MIYLIPAVITLLLLVGIVVACQIFTNAIEWLGHRHQLSQGAVGSVLAAVGTAMPETLVPLIALATGWGASQSFRAGSVDISIGAILGAPFLLSTLALFVSGVAVYIYANRCGRSLTLSLDAAVLKRDLLYFLPGYLAVFLAGFIGVAWIKTVLASGLLVGYGVYVYRTLNKPFSKGPDHEDDEIPEALLFARHNAHPSMFVIWLQLIVGLGGIILLAHFFVDEMMTLSHLSHLPPMLISLILTPIATELPEKCNSVVWLAKGKDGLALGNITGALVFHSCILGAIGLALTPWVLDRQGVVSVVLCLASALVLLAYVHIKQRVTARVLLWGGVFYSLFLIYSVWQVYFAGHRAL